MQDREAHAVPFPGRAGRAALRAGHHSRQRMARRQRMQQRVHFEIPHHRGRAARVVGVVVRDHHRVQPLDPRGAQVGRDDALAAVGIGAEGGAGVVEQRAIGGAHQHREPLPHVQRRDPRFARRGRGRRQRDRGQHQREARRAPGQAARREQPGDPGEREQHRPERRRVLLPYRRRQVPRTIPGTAAAIAAARPPVRAARPTAAPPRAARAASPPPTPAGWRRHWRAGRRWKPARTGTAPPARGRA